MSMSTVRNFDMFKMAKLPIHIHARKYTVHLLSDEKLALLYFILQVKITVVSHRTYRAVKRTEKCCAC